MKDFRRLLPFTLELDIKHLDLRISDDELYERATKDQFFLEDCFYLIKKGYDELWYSKNTKGQSVIIAVSKEGQVELYDLFVESLFRSGRNESSTLRDALPVILDTDYILDKINKYGMNMLTKEEKEYLNRLSN